MNVSKQIVYNDMTVRKMFSLLCVLFILWELAHIFIHCSALKYFTTEYVLSLCIYNLKKGKFRRRTGHEGPEGE